MFRLHRKGAFMTIERRKGERNPFLTAVSVMLCCAGLLAIAFSISLRVIQTELLPKQLALLHLTTNVFDQLNSSFEYILTITLVLSGLIVDLIGSRIILAIAVAAAIAANYLFSTTHSLATLLYCRFATENAHIFILISVLTLGAHWLPRRHFSIYVGLVFGTLLLVPMVAAAPLKRVVSFLVVDYINIFITIIGLIIFSIVMATLVVPHRMRRRSGIYSHFNPLRYYKIWLIGLVAMVGWTTNKFFLSIGSYYFSSEHYFTAAETIHVINNSFVFFGVGCILMGIISDFLKRKRLLIVISYFLASLTCAIMIFAHNLSTQTITWLVWAVTFLVSSNVISYTKSTDYCTAENSGITLGLVLTISTVGSSLVSKAMFYNVQKYIYTPVGIHIYNWDYIVVALPIMLILGAAISLFLLTPTPLQERRLDDGQRAGDQPFVERRHSRD